MTEGSVILFRCDGSPEIGLGHVVRCLALADELSKSYQCQVAFAMRCGPLGFEMVQQKGYAILTAAEDRESFDYARWLTEVVRGMCAQALVLDVRDGLPRFTVQALRDQGVLIVTLDDPSERRLAADLAFHPPVPQVQRLDWTGFTGRLYVGWEWVALRREFARRLPAAPGERPEVLVTMGGSDPAGLTLRAVKALDLLEEDFETKVVLGPGFVHHLALDLLLAKRRHHFEIHRNVNSMSSLMSQASLAVVSFGVTAYELAAMGVPAIYLCLTEDHDESASALVDADIALNMRVFTDVTEQALAEKVRHLLKNPTLRVRMSERGRKMIDGRGAERIARLICERIKAHG